MDKPIVIISILLVSLTLAAFSLHYFQDGGSFGLEKSTDSFLLMSDSAFPADSLVVDSPTAIDEGLGGAVAAGAHLLSGDYLTGWKTNKHWPIASITKLASALVALEKIGFDTEVLIDQEAVNTIGNSGGFSAGEKYEAGDLVTAMLIVSSNDAAVALANHYGSEKFVEEMNVLADRLGMEDTNFVDPIGLSVDNRSTITDLLKLVSYIWNNEKGLFDISRQSTGSIVDINAGEVRQLVSINAFANRADFLGGKTGMLPVSDGNLISIFSVPGRSEPVVIIVFGSKDRFGETANILSGL